jgi:hypothetical protein
MQSRRPQRTSRAHRLLRFPPAPPQRLAASGLKPASPPFSVPRCQQLLNSHREAWLNERSRCGRRMNGFISGRGRGRGKMALWSGPVTAHCGKPLNPGRNRAFMVQESAEKGLFESGGAGINARRPAFYAYAPITCSNPRTPTIFMTRFML